MRFNTISGMLVLFVCLIGAVGCEKKGEEVKAEGALEISVEPDPVTITPVEGEYTIRVTAQETGGAAVDFTQATVVITYLDSTHIMNPLTQEDLTTTQLTWTATTPVEGGPVVALLEQFWHLDAGESKEYELPLKIGTGTTARRGFRGYTFLYLISRQRCSQASPALWSPSRTKPPMRTAICSSARSP